MVRVSKLGTSKLYSEGNTHKNITLPKKIIVPRTCCNNEPTIAAVMAAKNCEKSEKGDMVCGEAENSESENVSGEIEKKGFSENEKRVCGEIEKKGFSENEKRVCGENVKGFR